MTVLLKSALKEFAVGDIATRKSHQIYLMPI